MLGFNSISFKFLWIRKGDYDRYDYDHHRDYDRGVLRSVTTMAVTTIDRGGFDSCHHRFLVTNHPRARRG
jgi:hypothetical protein